MTASSELLQEEFSTKPHQNVYTFDIEDIETLKTLIRFCYNGRMLITLQNVLPIAEAAVLLKMQDALLLCFQYMKTQLNASNCIQCLFGSRNIGLVFQQFIKKYVVEHFAEVIANKLFIQLSADELHEFLRNNDLKIDSEETLFRALTKWYRHDAINRQSAIKEMLPLIRFGNLSPEVCIQSIN